MIRLSIALLLSVALFAQGQDLLEQASSLAARVLARNPSALHAHLIIGVVAAQKNDWDVAAKHFQAVLRLDPANPFGYFYLGQAKLYQHQWEQAIQYFAKALERQYPDQDRLLVEIAVALNEAGHPREALANLHKVAPPADRHLAAQYYAVTAFARAKLNEPGAALEAIRRAIQFDDASPDYWDFLIGLLIQTDQAPQALAEAIRAQRKFPDHADTLFLFALASYHVSESPLSHVAWRNLSEAEPASPRVLLAQGLMERKQGKNEEATRSFQRAAERGVPDAHLLLGIVYKENGDYPAAEREYREAERLNPRNGQALLELGKLLLARGQLQEARDQLEKAALYMADAASVHYQLGLVYRRLGQTEKAQQHLRLAKQP